MGEERASPGWGVDYNQKTANTRHGQWRLITCETDGGDTVAMRPAVVAPIARAS